MKTIVSTTIFFLLSIISVTNALDQAKLEAHHKKLKEKLCDANNKVPPEDLDKCMECHDKLVPKDVSIY